MKLSCLFGLVLLATAAAAPDGNKSRAWMDQNWRLLENPPSKVLFPRTPWLEWRQEVRDGKRTIRLQERKGE